MGTQLISLVMRHDDAFIMYRCLRHLGHAVPYPESPEPRIRASDALALPSPPHNIEELSEPVNVEEPADCVSATEGKQPSYVDLQPLMPVICRPAGSLV